MTDFLFSLYKALSQFLMPLGIAILGAILAVFLFFRMKRKPGLTLLVAVVAWLWFWSTPWWSDVMRGFLESEYVYQAPDQYPRADAIVVLGGGVRGYAGGHLPPVDLNRAADRDLFASQLFKAGKSQWIILSGGSDPVRRTGTQTFAMKVFLIHLGIPARNIITGTGSRNTLENKAEVVELLRKTGGDSIILVTSALHMPRAVWLFSKAGFTVTPAPTDFEVVPNPFTLKRILPDAEALENSSRALREVLGLAAYRMGFR